ncbi:hypothetical protein JB92DRAFT_2935975 [Gautieria morchelliformis]|nr:hypothetical protein JB92DRAFT_2935975 [Gautieria morchelliformis]
MDTSSSGSDVSTTAGQTGYIALNLEHLSHQQNDLVEQQSHIFHSIVEATKALQERVKRSTEDAELSMTEVEMWKKAFLKEQQRAERAEQQAQSHKRQMAIQVSKDRDSIVLALIDGDGYIFKDELLKRGRDGGREAAQTLNEKILARVGEEEQNRPRVQVWTYFFCNLKGLQQTLVGHDVCTSGEYEAFMTGFNQANSRFTINDVHSGKEAADSKIKAYLQTWTRFPQVLKVYLGVCHDNGYHPTLAELQSDGLLDKIVLLQGYEQVATEIQSLHLPMLQIDNLFRSEKVPTRIMGDKRVTPPSPTDVAGPKLSYTSVVEHSRPAPAPRVRHRIVSTDNPPPCNLFYLSKCNKGADCKYAHDYILEAEHYDTLRENGKKSPCPAVNLDSPCPFGENCALGHKCPQGPQCFHRKLDRCWFKGKTMHV